MSNLIKNQSEEDVEDHESPKSEIFQVKPANEVLTVYFYDDIREPSHYMKLVDKINNLVEGDVVEMHFACDGGMVTSMMAIINALKTTPATIRACLDSHAYSASAIIFLCADEWTVGDATSLMFHNYSAGFVGKGHEISSVVRHTDNTFKKMFDNYCSDFLTEKEINDIIDGKDLYLDADEIRVRLEQMVKGRNEQILKSIKEKVKDVNPERKKAKKKAVSTK